MSLINLVHPKLLFFYLILIGTFAYSQSPNGITTSEGDYFNITLCEGDFVTFTLDPFTSAPTTGEEYIFYRIRSGVGTVTVQLQSTSNSFTMTASATGVTGLQNGDKIYGRRINNNVFLPQIIDSDVITVSILSSSSTSTLDGGVIDQQNQLLCLGDVAQDLTVSSISSGPSFLYQWQSSLDNLTYSDIPGATFEVLVMGTVTQTTYFRRKVSHASGGSCEKFSTWHKVELSDLNPGVLDPSQDQILCKGDRPVLLESGAGGSDASATMGTISYQWQQSIDKVSWSQIGGATNASYAPPSLLQTTYYRRSATNTAADNASCALSTNIITITVDDLTSGVLDPSQNTTLCYNSIPPTIVSGSGGSDAQSSVGSITYQWEYSKDNTNWSTLVSATSSYYVPTQAVTQTHWFRRIAFSKKGSLVCSDTTNAIQFLVYDEIDPGSVTGSQIICEGDIPASMNLVGDSPVGLTYQWQSSTDNINFTNIANNSSSLSFSSTTPWTPTLTTYYRVVVSNSGGCTATSSSSKIEVIKKPTLLQISGGAPYQTVCPGTQMTPVAFQFGGSATGISVTGLTGSGLTVSNTSSGVYTLTGTPIADISLTLTTTGSVQCIQPSVQYNIYLTQSATTPELIRKDVDDEYHTVFEQAGLWYNNTTCQSSVATTTQFFVCEDATLISSPTYEWRVTPASAGLMDASKGEILWNQSFSGTALVGVRALSCGGNSNWLDTPIEVIPIGASASLLTTPTTLINDFCDLDATEVPSCQINSSTLDTHFFATTASGSTDYASIEWSIDNIIPGGGLGAISNPGTINSATGVMSWNVGFWGSLNVIATAINCDGTKGPSSFLRINISEAINTTPSILTVSPTTIPNCPTQKGAVTRFRSNIPVTWSIDDANAGVISSIDSYTGEMVWEDGFSGILELTANADDGCSIGESVLRMSIPGQARIESALGIDNVTICQGTYLNGVEYSIEGFPTSASVVDLPLGVTGTFSATNQIVDIVYSGIGFNGQTYRLEIFGQTYSYTISGTTETADQMIVGLSNEVNSSIGSLFTANRVAPNTLRLRANVSGFAFSGTVYFIRGSIEIANILTVQSPRRTITLTGTVTAAPGIYDYTIATIGGSSTCSNVTRVGRITVTGLSSLTLMTGNSDQQICLGNAITPITFKSENALFTAVTGLPSGLSQTYSSTSGILEITGTPTANITQTTHYPYVVTTQSNKYGCSPEVTATGTITLLPDQLISLSSAASTANQTICDSASSPITPISYQLSGSANGYSITGAPFGVGRGYDPLTKVITLTGTPTAIVTKTTVFNYAITTTGSTCTPTTISGTITLEPKPSIKLTSTPGTDNQVATNGICMNSPIVPIEYEFENASSINVSGLPNGLIPLQTGNTITIYGSPSEMVTSTTRFTYTLTTAGCICVANASLSGFIDIIPLPVVDAAYVTNNDIINVSCNGLADGAINIPSSSPDFELRINGGQNAVAQKDRVLLTNQPLVGDVYSIVLNGLSYSHTVVASSFGGTVQSPAAIAQELIKEINKATGSLLSPVTASFQAPSSLELVADTPGTSFSVSTTLSTSYTGVATPSIMTSNVVSNVTLNYTYAWTGPNGFTSSNLSISNLAAGDYFLEVTYGGCTSSPVSFTITEPDPIKIDTDACNGGLKATVSGGTAPYTLNLFDSSNNLLRTDFTSSIHNYSGLVPGANYLLEVFDSNCSVPTQLPVKLPFALNFDSNIPKVVDDYCNNSNGDGFIELGGNAAGNAFSGGSNEFTYSWTGGPNSNFKANTRDIYGLEPGVYTVTVTDKNLGCTDQQSFTVGSVDPLVITPTANTLLNANRKIDIMCNGEQTALIEITVTGGLGNYSYSWLKDGVAMAGKTQPKLENVGVGKYTIVVRDAPPSGISATLSSCEATYDFEVVEPDEIKVFVNSGITTSTFCPEDNATTSLEIEILGGAPPFTVKLNDGQGGTFTVPDNKPFTYSKIDPSATGPEYEVSVEDANGCTVGTSSDTTVSYAAIVPIVFKETIVPIDCETGNLGSMSLEAVTGSLDEPEKVQVEWISPYEHLYHTWDSNKGKLEGIERGGSYQAIITYGGCELFNETFTLKDVNESVYLNSVEINGGGCNGELGSVSLEIQGGYQPYSIEWQQFKSSTVVDAGASTTPSGTSTTTTTTNTTSTTSSTNAGANGISTSTELAWTTLSQYTNNAIVSQLEPGIYRAIVKDASSDTGICSPYVITDVINIGTNTFEINNVEIRNAKSCTSSSTSAEIQFSILNTLPNTKQIDYELEILLDSKDPETDLIRLSDNTYKIIGIGEGSHTLQIKTGTTSLVLGSYADCSIVYAFDVEEQLPITYDGPTEIEIDPCAAVTSIVLEDSQISGGTPFEVNSALVYDYKWIYRPLESETPNQSTQLFVGSIINDAKEGTYELTITDGLGCESDPILFTVNAGEETIPFSVSGNLTSNSDTGNNLVKVLPPTCTEENDGQIGIAIEGGSRPYTIEWYRETIIPETTTRSSTVNLEALTNFTNTTYLDQLAPGKYKVKIQSQSEDCDSNLEKNEHLFYEEDIIVPKNDELYIVEGPFIDDNLCQLSPGKVVVEVFDNQSEDLTFYYNNELVTFEEQNSSNENKIYTIYIETPVQNADLIITSENGCQITRPLLISETAVPEFTYTTPSLEAENVILAKEEITFTNTSAPPYSYSEWNFGDGSDSETVHTDGLIVPVHHAYGIAGTYFVTLRNFSDLGCYKEYVEQIVIGKGYNIIAPNAFTPNGDLFNDRYRVLFSGFERVNFRVFDQRGDLLHSETVEQLQQPAVEPLQLLGWDGQNETGSSFYTYYFSGILITDQSEITQSGNFVLIK